MRRILPALVIATMLLLVLPQPILADSQVGVLRHFVTVPVAGLSAEGISARGNHFYVSTIGSAATDGSIFVFDKKGALTQTITLPGLPIVGQAAFFGDSLFVVACHPFTSGGGALVKVDLKTGVVNPTFATDPACPNGLTMSDDGTMYITNFAGSIDKVTQSGKLTLFASGGPLTPGTIGTFTIGPNDIVFNEDQNALYTTNTGQSTVVKVQINDDGSAGPMSVYAHVPMPDGLVFDEKGNLYVTSPFGTSIYLVTPNGSVSPVTFKGTETLDGPTAAIFHGHDLYITSSNSAKSHTSGYVSVVTIHSPDD
jgi:sugar lactone lactonase YvrE